MRVQPERVRGFSVEHVEVALQIGGTRHGEPGHGIRGGKIDGTASSGERPLPGIRSGPLVQVLGEFEGVNQASIADAAA